MCVQSVQGMGASMELYLIPLVAWMVPINILNRIKYLWEAIYVCIILKISAGRLTRWRVRRTICVECLLHHIQRNLDASEHALWGLINLAVSTGLPDRPTMIWDSKMGLYGTPARKMGIQRQRSKRRIGMTFDHSYQGPRNNFEDGKLKAYGS